MLALVLLVVVLDALLVMVELVVVVSPDEVRGVVVASCCLPSTVIVPNFLFLDSGVGSCCTRLWCVWTSALSLACQVGRGQCVGGGGGGGR